LPKASDYCNGRRTGRFPNRFCEFSPDDFFVKADVFVQVDLAEPPA